MPKPKKPEAPDRTTCGQCMRPVNRFEVMNALMNGLRYDHECGRTLVYSDDSLKVEDTREV